MRKHIAILASSTILLLAGCGGPQPEQAAKTAATVAPTVAPAAQKAAPTVAAAAATAAPTVVAAAQTVAPTLVAQAATVGATVAPTIAAAAGTAVAASPLQITAFQLIPTPQFTLRNTGTAEVDLSGFEIQVGNVSVGFPANAEIAPGETATVHLTQGTSAGDDIFIGSEVGALVSALRPGANVELVNAQGQVITQFQLP